MNSISISGNQRNARITRFRRLCPTVDTLNVPRHCRRYATIGIRTDGTAGANEGVPRGYEPREMIILLYCHVENLHGQGAPAIFGISQQDEMKIRKRSRHNNIILPRGILQVYSDARVEL